MAMYLIASNKNHLFNTQQETFHEQFTFISRCSNSGITSTCCLHHCRVRTGGRGDNKTVTASSGNVASHKVTRDILSYVPADTIYFFGGLEPASLRDMITIIEPQWGFMQPEDFKKTLDQQLPNNKNMPPAMGMLTGLFIEYVTAFKDLETVQNTLGLTDELDAVLYSVGTIPVMRIKLADTNAFNAFINSAEAMTQVTSVQGSHGELSFKTYRFSTSENGHQNAIDAKLVISVDNDYALITLLTSLEDQATLDVILGVKKPANSLADATLLTDLTSRHNFHPAYLGYINHEEIVKGLTPRMATHLATCWRHCSTPSTHKKCQSQYLGKLMEMSNKHPPHKINP